MKKSSFLFFLIVIIPFTAIAQSKDELAVRKLLTTQGEAWNKGDIDGYMEGYWKSDSLMFIGKSGVTFGWKNTLSGYKKSYPDSTAMGQLSFEYVEMKRLSADYFFVVGKWLLIRKMGNLKGAFTLLLLKIDGNWVIIKDHSS